MIRVVSGIVTRCGAMVVWCGVVRPETMVWCGVVWCGGSGGGGGAVAVSGGSVSHVTEARLCPPGGSYRHSESCTSPSQSQHERNCPHPGRPVWQPDRSQGRNTTTALLTTWRSWRSWRS